MTDGIQHIQPFRANDQDATIEDQESSKWDVDGPLARGYLAQFRLMPVSLGRTLQSTP